jgi:cell division protein FtsB
LAGKGSLGTRILLLSVGALALVATFGALFGDRGYLEVRRYSRQVEELEAEIRELEAEVRKLHREIHALRTDPRATERIAREQLILARPDEVLFLLPEEEPSAPAAPAPGDDAR